MEEIDEIVQEFLVGSHENLDQLDRDLVALEREPDSRDLLGSISAPSTRSRARAGSWLPDRKDIKDLFEGLLGRDVAITEGRPVDIGIPKPVIASYVDDASNLRAVAVMSFGLAARSGAALALVPRGAAEAAEEDRLLPDNLFENASEICNVLAAPFGDAMGTHLRLSASYAPSSPVPGQLLGIASQLAAREDVDLEITGYGTGTLSLVVCV